MLAYIEQSFEIAHEFPKVGDYHQPITQIDNEKLDFRDNKYNWI